MNLQVGLKKVVEMKMNRVRGIARRAHGPRV
jgi:hypothetical protein